MDDTTRGVGRPGAGDEFSGRADETTRNYAGDAARTAPRTTPPRTAPAGGTTRGTGTSGSTGASDLDPEAERRTREIQGEIASTRAELSETIDALQERLRPGNIVSDATERVKTATSERVRDMADRASGTAQGLMEEARHNAVPALMIGAGVAWMLMDRSRHRSGRYREHAEYSTPRHGAYGTNYAGTEEYYESSARYADEEYGYDRSWTGGRSSEGMSRWARDAGSEARHTARRATNGFQRMLHENPLLVGAAAMLLGAAIGASLPETERENEWMGETRDTVLDKAQETAQNAVGAVKEATNDVVGDTVSKVAEKVTGSEKK
jgi:Protein of unknown function (DUF3618)